MHLDFHFFLMVTVVTDQSTQHHLSPRIVMMTESANPACWPLAEGH